MATDKLAEGIRLFAADTVKLERLVAAQLADLVWARGFDDSTPDDPEA